MKRLFLILLFPLLGSNIEAQDFPTYPTPLLTPKVRQLLEDREKWYANTQETLPSFVDNSKLKYFPPIFLQIGGSCAQSSGIRYLFTYEMNRFLNRSANTNENIYSYFYTWNFINEGSDQGGFAEEGLAIARTCGIMSLADFPDQTSAYSFRWMSGYDKYIRAMHYRVTGTLSIDVTSQEGIDNLKHYLYGDGVNPGHIVTFSSQAQNWKFNSYYNGPSNTGYKSLLTQLATSGAHAMTIVGYDDAVCFDSPAGTSYGAFIVANSYGSGFGDNGYFYLPYYFFLTKHDSVDLSHSVTGIKVEYTTPKLVVKMKVKYDSRNDLSLTVGVANKAYAEGPIVSFPPAIINNQGGDYPMQGQYDGSEIELAIDASSLVDKVNSFEEPKYFLTVNRSERGKTFGTGKLEFFSVVDYRENIDNPREFVCKDLTSKEFEKGSNLFMIATSDLMKTSASSCCWMDAMKQLYQGSFVVRASNGHYAKLQFLKYDASNKTVKLKYLYQSKNNRDLSN